MTRLEISEAHAEQLHAEMFRHADDVVTGACQLCKRSLCAVYRSCRAELTACGRLDDAPEPPAGPVDAVRVREFDRAQRWDHFPTTMLPVVIKGLSQL